jgi:hypothetical protein
MSQSVANLQAAVHLAIQKCKESTIEMRTFGSNHQVRCIRLDAQGNLPVLTEGGRNV